MADNGSSLLTPVNLGVILYPRSYWASHFYSVLECLRYHNTLEYPGRRLEAEGIQDWSLLQLRGFLPKNFFAKIDQPIQNWGFQYFLVSLLNDRMGAPAADALISAINEIWSVNIGCGDSEREFRISGADSDLSAGIDAHFDYIFPSRVPLDTQTQSAVINDSDLCLIVKKREEDSSREYVRYAVFGEVEGLHGHRLTRPSFWQKKSAYRVFAIGVVREEGTGFYINTRFIDGYHRVLLTFQSQNPVVVDFRTTLWWMQNLLEAGPLGRRPAGLAEELGYFLDLLTKNWKTPISELLTIIGNHVRRSDLVESVPFPTTIITNLQA